MLVLKYKKAEYDNRIRTLNDYIKRLGDHLSNLEGYKDQIKNFWEDENADALYSSLSEMIRKVNAAIEKTNTCVAMCENAVNAVDAGNIEVGGLLGDAIKLITAAMA